MSHRNVCVNFSCLGRWNSVTWDKRAILTPEIQHSGVILTIENSVGSISSTSKYQFDFVTLTIVAFILKYVYIALTLCEKSSTRTQPFYCRMIPNLELLSDIVLRWLDGRIRMNCYLISYWMSKDVIELCSNKHLI